MANIDEVFRRVCSLIPAIVIGLPLSGNFKVILLLFYVIGRTIEFYLLNYNIPKGWSELSRQDVALITGGSRGLGLEIVKKLKQKVGKVIIVDVAPPPAYIIEDDSIQFVRCNIGDEALLKYTLTRVIENLAIAEQHISVLINNAGIDHRSSLLDLPDEDIKQVFNVNSFAQIWTLRAVISNHMKQNSDKQLFIVSVASILGTLAPKNLTLYSASKAINIQVHEGLTQEVKELSPKVRLLLVTPGQLDTAMFDDIEASNEFFAPLVKHVELAETIVGRINKGHSGVLANPMYANLLPIVKCLPIALQDFCRWLSQMDNKIEPKAEFPK
ncbi:uncharacterized oxidoreductase Tda5p [[Candida] railenensis]|uniref:Uncharacterized oxidoreductase Tda5p n=1 Tax=[Candida] railenensis TaxID=45579 RepID=A0A9P0VW30_9ASCO|nr:uncharacterized oxidoreductase Tda5p [[Candida] railenensis]